MDKLIKLQLLLRNLLKRDVAQQNKIMFDETDMPLLLETRLVGTITSLMESNLIEANEQLSNKLNQLKHLTIIRNSKLLETALQVDALLEEKRISRVWLKSVAEIYSDPAVLSQKKIGDADILVADAEKTKNILMENGFAYGSLETTYGKWVTEDMDAIQSFQANHYELYPLTKVIKFSFHNIDIERDLLNRYRIFKHEGIQYYTDITIDVHHALTFDLAAEWTLANHKYFPIMEKVDDLWYAIGKTYYEIVIGDAIDCQLLFNTIGKINKYNIEYDKTVQGMNQTGFLNEEAVAFLYDLAKGTMKNNQFNQFINFLMCKIENRIVTKGIIK